MPRRTCVVLTGGASNCARRTARTSINPTYSSNPRAVPPHQWLPILVASAPPPPAPPCTVANLKARTAGDKGWPIACANVVIGDKTQDLDLNSASLSYGDFEGATFNGKEKIDLQGAGLENANLRGSKFEMIRDDANGNDESFTHFLWKSNRIIFTDADLENADLSLSTFYADSKKSYSYGLHVRGGLGLGSVF
jgi:hypothetical protein